MRFLLWTLVALLLAPFAQAAEPPIWKIDQAKSSLTFQVKVNDQTVSGRFPGIGAFIRFDPANLAQSSVKATIDATGIKTFNATRDSMLLKPAWFNVVDFPQAIFQSTAFSSPSPNKYLCKGKLSLKGIEREINLPFTLIVRGNQADMVGQTTLKRLDFKVGDGPDYASDTPVALSVNVMVKIHAAWAR